MTTINAALKKLATLNINVVKETFEVTDFYYFTANGSNFEFNNQPIVNNNVENCCKVFSEGKPSCYATFNKMIKSITK